jgi:FtsH-binding integral membrane protein
MGAFGIGQKIDYRSREEELTVGQFFNSVYAWMCVGLATTAAVAYGMYAYGASAISMGTLIICFIAQLVLVVTITRAVNKINTSAATALFILFAALMGVTTSSIFYIYRMPSIATCFVETAGMFGAMSLYGYVTKRDLTRLGSLLFMALIGLIIASVINMFVASSAMYWIISYAGVVIFVGLTAFDTQRLKMFAIQNATNPALANRVAIIGSLTLYLNFINLFLFILQIMGNRQR